MVYVRYKATMTPTFENERLDSVV